MENNITKDKFRKYLEVQIEGKFNMNSKEAVEATGLTQDEYNNIKWNYNQWLLNFPDLFEKVEKEYIERLK